MSDFPVALHGERISALIVGGGSVATRKAFALCDAGARVTIVAPQVDAELDEAGKDGRLDIVRDSYRADLIDRHTLVIAATDNREVNARVAVDARRAGKLANIADAPDEGNFHTMALHRSGDVTIAVSSGGVPGAAARIRDAIAQRFDGRYERAVSALRLLRSRMLTNDARKWQAAAPALIGDDFCDSVENGTFTDKVAAWQ